MKPPRPITVKIAIGCIIASYVISTIEMLRNLNLSDWGNVIQIIGIFLAECAIVYAIYVRKNWVRFFFVATIALWTVSLVVFHFEGHSYHGLRLLVLALNFAFSTMAVVFLFYPESNAWFSKPPAPAMIEPQQTD